MLQGQDMQCVGEHEPPRYPIADSFPRPSHCGRIAPADGPQERLRLVTVLPDLLGPQLMMKFLVHCSPFGARSPLIRAGKCEDPATFNQAARRATALSADRGRPRAPLTSVP